MTWKTDTQAWLHSLIHKLPNSDSCGVYTVQLTGDEVFYIKKLIETEYMLSFNEGWPE